MEASDGKREYNDHEAAILCIRITRNFTHECDHKLSMASRKIGKNGRCNDVCNVM